MQNKPKKHRLFRRHRIVLWEDNGVIGMGKIVDSTLRDTDILKPTLKVGEISTYKRNSLSVEGLKRKRVWLEHLHTEDVGDNMRVPLSILRLPTDTDKKIYNKYRK